jgi:hypothetical protein
LFPKEGKQLGDNPQCARGFRENDTVRVYPDMSRLLPIRRPPSRRVSRPPSPATFSDALLRNWRGEFAAQYKRGRYFHMTLHPQHIGWSNRLQMLDEFLAELRGYPSLWNPTAAEYARYWLKTYPAGTHLRLEPNIWHDYPGSLS